MPSWIGPVIHILQYLASGSCQNQLPQKKAYSNGSQPFGRHATNYALGATLISFRCLICCCALCSLPYLPLCSLLPPSSAVLHTHRPPMPLLVYMPQVGHPSSTANVSSSVHKLENHSKPSTPWQTHESYGYYISNECCFPWTRALSPVI